MIELPGGRKVALPEEFSEIAALGVATEDEIGGVRQLVIADHRILHSGLKVGRDHSTWIKGRIEECRLVEGRDFEIGSPDLGNQTGRGGDRRSKVYRLSLSAAREVAMMEGSDIGKLVRRYYLWLESVIMSAEPAPEPAQDRRRAVVKEKREISAALIKVVVEAPEKIRKAFPTLSDEAVQAMFHKLSKMALGEALVPEPDLGGRMFTATEIATEHSITPQRLGLITKAAGIPRDETTGKSILGKSEHSDKQVPHWHWSEAGKAKVDEAIEGWKRKQLPSPTDSNDHTQH